MVSGAQKTIAADPVIALVLRSSLAALHAIALLLGRLAHAGQLIAALRAAADLGHVPWLSGQRAGKVAERRLGDSPPRWSPSLEGRASPPPLEPESARGPGRLCRDELRARLRLSQHREATLLSKINYLHSEVWKEREARFVVERCYTEKVRQMEIELDLYESECDRLRARLRLLENGGAVACEDNGGLWSPLAVSFCSVADVVAVPAASGVAASLLSVDVALDGDSGLLGGCGSRGAAASAGDTDGDAESGDADDDDAAASERLESSVSLLLVDLQRHEPLAVRLLAHQVSLGSQAAAAPGKPAEALAEAPAETLAESAKTLENPAESAKTPPAESAKTPPAESKKAPEIIPAYSLGLLSRLLQAFTSECAVSTILVDLDDTAAKNDAPPEHMLHVVTLALMLHLDRRLLLAQPQAVEDAVHHYMHLFFNFMEAPAQQHAVLQALAAFTAADPQRSQSLLRVLMSLYTAEILDPETIQAWWRGAACRDLCPVVVAAVEPLVGYLERKMLEDDGESDAGSDAGSDSGSDSGSDAGEAPAEVAGPLQSGQLPPSAATAAEPAPLAAGSASGEVGVLETLGLVSEAVEPPRVHVESPVRRGGESLLQLDPEGCSLRRGLVDRVSAAVNGCATACGEGQHYGLFSSDGPVVAVSLSGAAASVDGESPGFPVSRSIGDGALSSDALPSKRVSFAVKP